MGQSHQYVVPRYTVKLVRDNENAGPLQTLSADTAAIILTDLMKDIPHEEVWMLMLNAKSEITGAVKLAQGGCSGAGLLASDILRPAVIHNASGIVLGHNHPSGDTTPSSEDIALTKAVAKACEAICIPLIDHVVVGENWKSRTSFFEEGLL